MVATMAMIGEGALPDEALVLLAQSGDAAALERLLSLWYPRLLRHASTRHDRDDARDVVQETLLKVAQNIGGLANPQAFSHWVFAILRRRGIDYLRSERRHREGHATFDDNAVIADGDSHAAALECRSMLEKSENVLGHDGLEIVRLRFVAGLSLKEIANVVCVPVGTVKSRLHAATGRLKNRIAYNT